MVDTAPSPQVLKEFVENILDDLASGRITPDAAMVASLQYPYLRGLIDEHKDEIAGALQSEGGLRVVLEGVLRVADAAINKELPQFRVEKPDAQISPHDVVSRARALRAARSEIIAALGQQRAGVGKLRKVFINRLVQNWIAQTRAFIDKEKQQQAADALKTELEQGLSDVFSFEEASARVGRALKNTRVAGGAASDIQREAAPIQQELAVATQRLAGFAAIPKELLARLGAPRPDLFVSIAIQTISHATLSPPAALARAAALARTAEAISDPPPEKDASAVGVFFRAFTSTPIQKAFAAAADALLNQLSPRPRQEVIKATFSRALEGVLAKTDVLAERLGQSFVESELFRLVVDGAKKEFARGTGGGAGTKRARGALEDIIGSILRGPAVEPFVGNPREAILSYLELLATEARLPHDKRIIFPNHAPTVRVLSLLSGGLPDDARADVVRGGGFSSSSAFQAAASLFAQRLPSWQVFYIILLSSSGIGQRALVSLGGTGQDVVKAPGGAGMGVLSFFGNVGLRAISGVGRAGLSLVEGLGGGIVGMMFGGGLGALFNRFRGPRQPGGFFDDTPKVVALVIVAVILLLFVFPSFLNAKLTGQAAKYAALLVNSQAVSSGGPYTEELPGYDGPFPDGPTSIASCTVNHTHLTQNPFDPGGIGTHKYACAYDFDAPLESPVRAAHDGCVAFVRTEIPNNKKIKGSYGNYVLLAGTGSDGKPFYSLYAHLSQGSSAGLTQGVCVGGGDPMGRVDNTGHSTGTHLHLEFLDENRSPVTKERCFSSFSLPAGCVQQ